MVISALQSKLGPVLGGIIGYPINLIVSPILMVLSALFQPWFWLDFTWGAVSSVLGWVIGLVMILLGGEANPDWGRANRIVAPGYMGRFGAFSLGPNLIGDHAFTDWKHEYGHTWQNRVLGPLYLLVIALPSLISAGLQPSNHHNFYTERWADAWS